MGDTGTPPSGPADPWPEPAGAPLSELYYLPLMRLAALLTGDPAAAEEVAADSLAAVSGRDQGVSGTRGASACAADFVTRLQREVVTRSRRGRYYRRMARRRVVHPASWPEFAELPVVEALRGLRASAREAVVLIHYLDLPAARAATIAGVTENALRANLAAAMSALVDQLPAT